MQRQEGQGNTTIRLRIQLEDVLISYLLSLLFNLQSEISVMMVINGC